MKKNLLRILVLLILLLVLFSGPIDISINIPILNKSNKKINISPYDEYGDPNHFDNNDMQIDTSEWKYS